MTNPSRSRSKGREARWGSSLRVLKARMAQKPPMPKGRMAASLPPANMTLASPILMVRQASPRAWVEVAQAEQVARFGPRRFVEHGKQARTHVQNEHGDHERGKPAGAFVCKEDQVLPLVVWRPPMPEPRNTPTWSRSTWFKSRPESSRAWWAAKTENWVNRSARRTPWGTGKPGAGSKSRDFGGDLAVEGGGVEGGNGADAALALEDVFPKGVGGLAER